MGAVCRTHDSRSCPQSSRGRQEGSKQRPPSDQLSPKRITANQTDGAGQVAHLEGVASSLLLDFQ